VLTEAGGIVEVQGTAERAPFSEAEFLALMRLARQGTEALFAVQRDALAAV
jgi:ribonuclease PH